MNNDLGTTKPNKYLADSGVETLVREIGEAVRCKALNPGERLMPIRDLARKYQVSFNSARAATKRLEALGLVECKQGSGTYVRTPPEVTVERKARTAVSLLLDINAHIFSHLALHLMEQIQSQGLTVTNAIWTTDKGLKGLQMALSSWEDYPPKAIVVQWDYPGLDQTIEKMRPADAMVIATFRGTRFMPRTWHSVNPDWYLAHKIAAERLIKVGHKRIGFLGHERRFWADRIWYDNKKAWMLQTDNIKAVGDALREAEIRDGLTICYLQYNKITCNTVSTVEMDCADNLSRIRAMLERPDRPTALVGSDYRLVIAKRVAESMGLSVPDDLALVGIGHTPWSQISGFPSVQQQEELAAEHIAELVKASASSLSARHHVVIPPVLGAAQE